MFSLYPQISDESQPKIQRLCPPYQTSAFDLYPFSSHHISISIVFIKFLPRTCKNFVT